MVMFGCFFWNMSMTCWVRLCRSSAPHQLKRSVTGSAVRSPPASEPDPHAVSNDAVNDTRTAHVAVRRCFPFNMPKSFRLLAAGRGDPLDEVSLSDEEREEDQEERRSEERRVG